MNLKSFICLVGICFATACSGLSQSTATVESKTDFPEEIEITWSVQTNYLDEGNRFRSVLTLLNQSDIELTDSGWALYFNFVRSIDPESLPTDVVLTHINGNLYKLEPTEQFQPIPSGQRLTVPFEAQASAIKESDAPSGFYFITDGGQTIPVSDVKAEPFLEERQTSRGSNDHLPVPTPVLQFEKNAALNRLTDDSTGQIVPTPLEEKKSEGAFSVDSSVRIGYEKGLQAEAFFLAEALEELLGDEIAAEEESAASSDIFLRLGSVYEYKTEAYELNVTPQRIEIVGTDSAGIFYGIQSLRALVPPEAYQKPQNALEINSISVKDAPRFSYRGLHLDVARNFQPAPAVKKLIDVMAFYKLNTFHFHLTDDEGWRLPIEELPELTEVGGRRGHTQSEDEHMIPSYGSGPDPEAAPGSGWYDRETFIEVLQYAKERHIEVVPEIDIPGHARAAIVAMKSRYNKLKAKGEAEAANRFRLHEPEDQSKYRSMQNWDDNVINICQPSTYRFMETVIDEVVEIYHEAETPLTTIHLGGDEVPHGAWEQSPACQKLIRHSDDLNSVDDLPDYFFERMHEILAEHDLVMAGWEEIALDEMSNGTAGPDPDFAGRVRPYIWANIWGAGTEDHAYKLANAGYDVVMSQASNFYFDFAYNKHPQEPGFYWGGFVDIQDPYSFIPFDLYKNAETNVMGSPIPDTAFAGAASLTKNGRNNILGLQGQLWGETLKSQDRMEYMAVPRLLALAERSWTQQPSWVTISSRDKRNEQMTEAWNEFANRLGQRELPRLDFFHGGINYRLPPPGATIEDGVLNANVDFPGLMIRYTLDGSKPTVNSKKYTEPVSVQGAPIIKLRTFSSAGRGSRTVAIGE